MKLKNRIRPCEYSAGVLPILFLTATGGAVGVAHGQESADAGRLEELVVTGTRRAERASEVPVAISLFSEEDIERAGIRRPEDFLTLTSSATIVESNNPSDFFITIRGNTQQRAAEAAVAYVLDGVPFLDQRNFNRQLLALEQIEVHKGPQGALYGRNAIGGAIVINTRKPSFDELEGRVTAGFGNNSSGVAEGWISAPIIDDELAFRVGARRSRTDGSFVNDISREKVHRRNELQVDGRLMYLPNDRLTVDLKGEYIERESGAVNWSGLLAGVTIDISEFSANNVSVPWTNNIPGIAEGKRTNLSAKVDFEVVNGVTLTSITAYQDLQDRWGGDGFPYLWDPGQFDIRFPGTSPIGLGAQTQWQRRDSEVAFQELRLTSADEQRLRWLVGGYYAEFRLTNVSIVGVDRAGFLIPNRPSPFGSGNQTRGFLFARDRNEAYAFYGTLDYDVTERLTASASLRYDRERKKQTDFAQAGPPVAGDPRQLPTWTVAPGRSRSATFSESQPKLSLAYAVTDSLNTYASWGRGFKAGGWNPFGTGVLVRQFNPDSTVDDIFPSEVAETVELGAKWAGLENRLLVNAAVFRTDTDNAQLQEFLPQANLNAISTADKVRMYGAELDAQVRVTTELGVILAVGYLDAEVREFSDDPGRVGNKRPNTSPWTVNVSLDYGTEVGADTFLFGRIDYRYQGATTWDWVETPGTRRDPFSLVDLNVGIERGSLTVRGWMKNALNKKYNTEMVVLLPGVGALWRAPERTYGVELSYAF